MINAETISQRKLITFADNRQDAAFQAAWMADHARRYRLRQLMYLHIEGNTEPISIGDLQQKLLVYLISNTELARTLIPEVYAGEIEEAYSSKIEEQLKKFLRISILRELVTGFRRRDSLETWGVARVDYYGLNEDDIKIKELSTKYGIASKTLVSGIETLLDNYRRTRFLYDESEPIYTHYWHYGDFEVQRGYIPYMDFPPKGLKYQKEEGDKINYVSGFSSAKGQTVGRNFINKWGIADDKIQELLRDIWAALSKDWNILTSVTLRSNKGNPLGGATGVFQIDSRKMGIVKQHERYTCNICHRVHTRDTPNHSCSRIHCYGTLQREDPPADDYSISLLKHDFQMLVAREHTAQVPAKIREALEDDFKRPDGKVNCLVATPTLELGVDIGDLDIILMRNMPPLSSNYWQRAGRAGRRHQMAVIYTYCRNNAHDEYFFDDPYRILSGRIYPPKFNMRNNVMIRKHVHATIISVLTRISQLKNPLPSDTPQDLENLRLTLRTVFPIFISDYLFESDGTYKKAPLDVSPLNKAIERYKAQIEKEVIQVFADCWPKDAEMEVKPEVLTGYMNNMSSALQERINLLHTRLMWTINTRNKILEKEKIGRLEEIEERLLRRCREYLKTLTHKDLNTYTLTVLAREGFLPGYGTYEGNITAFAGTAYTSTWHKMAFELTRSPTIAVREYIPGNLIYANGGKYRTVLLHLPFSEERITPDEYILDVESQRIVEKGVPTSGYSGDEQPVTISGLPICDVDIGFISHVSDEESNRYKLPVYIAGYLQSVNRGGISYTCGGNEFDHLIGQDVRLVNVGPSNRVTNEKYGYPVCTVCGGTRSPFASEKEIENFKNYHTKSCGKEPGWYAITSDATVDGILFKKLTSQDDAINLAEAVRIGANQTLEMKPEDLQILILPQGAEEWDVFLYDHMAGGSGLLNQLIERWQEIISAANTALKCSNSCEKSCYVCMRSFYNMHYHELLDRKRAIDLLIKYDHPPQKQHDITPKAREGRPSGQSTNLGESRLRQILLDHGFPEFDAQKTISIPHSKYKTTTPDLLRVDPVTGVKVAIYLDGLSKGIHGNQERQHVDSIIRAILRSNGYHVEEISSSTLDDPELLKFHLRSIAIAINLKFEI
ncbi:MAG: helicase-related protein [Candidatus Methanoperedens sp.]